MDSLFDVTTKVDDGITQEALEVSVSETFCSKKIKPRALIFKATDQDLNKIKKLIETQFKVEIIYVTTGSAASILHVTKSMPFEKQNSPVQPLQTIE
jgi:hypothetical protein